MKVYITRKIPDIAVKLLEKSGFKSSVYKEDQPIPPEVLAKNIVSADGIISLLTDKLDSEMISKMKKCKVIANYAAGYNNIDVKAASEKGIIVTNTPDVLTESTADIAMTLVLTCARRFTEGENMMRNGKFNGWKPDLLLGYELKNKVFGILGAGRIGLATAIRARAFGTKIIYYSRSKNPLIENKTGARKVSLDYLLKNSDIISVHLPLNGKTFRLLSSDKLELMKRSAIFINTARGEVTDEKYLIKMLKKNRIFAAGFDVYENEPDINPDFFGLNNVTLLPHLGSATFETRTKMAELAAKNIIAVLSGKKPLTPVS